METLSFITRLGLRCTPRLIKDVVRRATPRAFYLLVARMAAGDPVRPRDRAQLHMSDPRVRALENRLWHGFSGPASADLQRLQTAGRSEHGKAEAAMVLARFRTARGEYAEALESLAIVRACGESLSRHPRCQIIEMYALRGLGRWDEAEAVARQAREDHPGNAAIETASASMILAAARHSHAPDGSATHAWLDGLNNVLASAGLASLTRRDSGVPLTLDNLKCAVDLPASRHMPVKVSVLMAVYNRCGVLECAVSSVLAQTWSNLELVIVDDASTDESWSLIQKLAAEDDRIVPVHQADNGGAYVARNAALETATGDYVTVNDADDWAHPQKIQCQIEALLVPGASLANVSALMRVDGGMIAQPRFDNPRVPVVHKNFSSLMLPRQMVLAMGGWDRVRISGDSELLDRLCVLHGASAVAAVLPDVPLSLALLERKNLTSASSRSLWTFHFGARREYARQFKEWHQSCQDGRMRRTSDAMPFPVPGPCLSDGEARHQFDTVLVSDFQDANCLRPHLRPGETLAILPWPEYGEGFDRTMGTPVSRLCRELGIITLVHGQDITCRRLLLLRPRLLLHPLDKVPAIHAEEILMPPLPADIDQRQFADNVRLFFGGAARCVDDLGVPPS